MSGRATDSIILQRLSNQMSRGEVVLFTGAGFSRSAQARLGDLVPSVDQLKEKLWAIGFPGEDFDATSSLGDIFEVALRTARNRTRELFETTLRVDTASLPENYELWYSMPWSRIYTLNVDDLDEAVARKFDLPRPLEVVSAIAQEPLTSRERLLSIHLNGTLDDFPNVTFSQRQYGERLAQPDLWYLALIRDLRSSPVVYVGTTLDEPSLWQHIEMRGRQGSGRELRPGSYLVSPKLPAARRAILKDQFNVDWVPLSADGFARDVLSTLGDAQREGIRRFAEQRAIGDATHALQSVADLRTHPSQDPREYLLAREPVWADFTSDGFAVYREFEAEIESQIVEAGARALIVTGTGGSGKSTTLMRFALERQAAGQDVRWVDLSAEVSIPRLRRAIRESRADVVVIDDADSFGTQTGPFLSELLAESDDLFVTAALRASRYDALGIRDHLDAQEFVQLTIPLLEDVDIDLLLDSLTRAQRLGVLRGMSRDEQREAFQRAAGRQLLVAMIEATTGERFDEKINRECRDLGLETGLMYAVVAIATSMRADLTRQEVVLAGGDTTNAGLNRLQGLLNQHLLVPTAGGLLRLRHRVIAEKAVEYFRAQRQLGDAVRGLMFALAAGIDRSRPRSRESRLLVRLMNHDWLIRYLPGDREGIRAAYDAIEDLVSWDYHYWLQRGSFEVEIGDLQTAQNLLEQARALAPDDYKVQTEWAYLVIKRAAQNPAALESRDRVDEAFVELEDAVSRRGHQDSYPAHVMGSQGLSWVRQAPLTQEEKLGVLARLRGIVETALEDHPTAGDLRQLARDLEQEYLVVGTARRAP